MVETSLSFALSLTSPVRQFEIGSLCRAARLACVAKVASRCEKGVEWEEFMHGSQKRRLPWGQMQDNSEAFVGKFR